MWPVALTDSHQELALEDEKHARIAPPFDIERPFVDTQGKAIASSPRRSTASSSPASRLSPPIARSASPNRHGAFTGRLPSWRRKSLTRLWLSRSPVSSTPPPYIRSATRLHPPDSSWQLEKTEHVPVAELEAQAEAKIEYGLFAPTSGPSLIHSRSWCIHVELTQREDGQGVQQYFFQDVDGVSILLATPFYAR